MKIRGIRATIHNMAQADILDMVGLSEMERIKAMDDKPTIKVYSVGHEGESKGRVIGVGAVVQRWTKEVIEKLGSVIKTGTGLYKGHQDTNETAGRRRMGEVVGSKVIEEGGKAKALVAAWFYPQAKEEADSLDVCSIETDIDFKMEGGGATVVDVLPVTGVALGSSAEGATPGFPESGLVASLQMFIEKAELQEEKPMDRKAVETAIKDLNLTVGDLFDFDSLTKSKAFQDAVKASQETDTVRDLREYGTRWKKTASDLETELKDLKAKVEKGGMVEKAEHDKVVLENVQFKSRPTVLEVAKELKLSDKETAFLETNVDSFNPGTSDEAEIKVKAKEFVEAQKTEFAKVAAIVDPEFTPESAETPATDDMSGGDKNPFLPDPIKVSEAS